MTVPPVASPLSSRHALLGARLGTLGETTVVRGYPEGRAAEVHAVREAVGVLDLSHLGAFEVSGPDRNAFVNRVACNDVAALAPDQLHFSALLTERGTFLDEITVLRFAERLLLIVNAENTARAWDHIVEQKRGANIRLRDISIETGQLTVEGPGAEALLQPLADRALSALPFRGIARARIAGCDVFCARQSYSGEDGIELLCRERDLGSLWDAIVDAGARPFGLDARELLRLEMGYVAWGAELDETVMPAEAGLAWIAPTNKGAPFVGARAVRAAAARGPIRRLAGLRPEVAELPLAAGDEIHARGRLVGRICSTDMSQYAGGTIATAYLTPGLEVPGTPLMVHRGAVQVSAMTVGRPFIGPRSRRG